MQQQSPPPPAGDSVGDVGSVGQLIPRDPGSSDVLRFLSLLYAPDDVVELRAYRVPKAGTVSGYFNDRSALVREIALLDGKSEGVFTTLNSVQGPLLSRASNRTVHWAKETTKDHEVLRRRNLLIDLDPKRASGIPATQEEQAAALRRAGEIVTFLDREGWPEPLWVASGNGYHLIYGIDESADPETRTLIKSVLRALAYRFDDDAVTVDTSTANESRLIRVAGTWSKKGDSTTERPHRQSAIVSAPQHLSRVPRDVLQRVAEQLPEAPKGAPREGIDVETWLRDHGIGVARSGDWDRNRRWILTVCPWNPEHVDGAAYVVQGEGGWVAAGCHHDSCKGRGWRELKAVFGEPSEPSVVDAIKALPQNAGIEALHETLASFHPPGPALDQAAIRERLLVEFRERGVGSPAKFVDAWLSQRKDQQDALVPRTTPWEDPVDGKELLWDVRAALTRYVVLAPEQADAVALWTMAAWAFDRFSISPILMVTSPTKRSGKTTLLRVLMRLVPRPLSASNITPASLFRTVEKVKPTLLIDEADTFAVLNEELRGILNSGHDKDTARVIRTTGPDHEPTPFSTWAPKILALIGQPTGTVSDRSITIRMRRRAPIETIARLRDSGVEELQNLARRMHRWAIDHGADLAASEPQPVGELGDRAEDNWGPLLAVADLCGGVWPVRAREVARLLSREDVEDEDLPILLLEDIRNLFAEADSQRLGTREIRVGLTSLEERPWGDFSFGRAITPEKIAGLLRPFGIRPRSFSGKKRGYVLHDFRDAFARYLPSANSALIGAEGSGSEEPGDDGMTGKEEE